jgi:hypothetical protein
VTKPKTVGSFNRVREERELADEIFILAGADAYRRNLVHLLVGLPRAKVLDWYYSEYPEIQRYVERHIEAGICVAAVHELRSEVAKTYPQQPRQDKQRETGSEWMDKFRMEPRVIPTRPKVAAIEWSPKERPRGITPVLSNRVEREMRDFDPVALTAMTEEAMVATFKVKSRDTVRKVRNKVLSKK